MRFVVIFIIVFFIFGCNVLNNPRKPNSTLQIPLKISTKIPKFLYKTLKKDSRKNLVDSSDLIGKKSSSFEVAQEFTEFFLGIEEILITNNQITNLVLSDIKQRCSDIKENEVCTIKKNQIKFTLTQQILKNLKTDKIMADDLNATIGDEVQFGDIEFIKYNNVDKYDYAINIDFTNIIRELYNEKDIVKIIHSTLWSEENKTVLSTVELADKDGEQNSFSIHFEKSDDLKENMYLYYKERSSKEMLYGIHNFFIANLFDSLQSSIISFNGIVVDKNNSDNSAGYGSFVKINNENGLQILYVKDKIDTDKANSYVSNEIIDFQGTLLATTFCYEGSDICSMDDTQSWYTSTNDSSIFSPIEKYSKKIAPIDIPYNQFEDGSYFFISSSVYHDNISIQEVLSQEVGSFVITNQNGYGLWRDVSYVNNHKELVLLQTKYNNELNTPLKLRDGKYFKKIKINQ